MAGLEASERVHKVVSEGRVDVHPTLNAVVVSYDMKTVILSDYGEPMVADVKDGRKVVKINNLTASTDITALAKTIISKVEVVRPDRCQEVEQVLDYLRNRATSRDVQEDVLKGPSQALQDQIRDLQEPTKVAMMSDIDVYLENLYEDLQGKIRGTGLILQLARTPDNLPLLIDNEPLILALTRVLREEWKKSIELTTNIVYIFFCFSTFSIFHQVLSQHKIGSTCMMVLEYEISRLKTLHDDLMDKKLRLKDSDNESAAASRNRKEYEKGKKKYQNLLKKQENLLRVTLYLLLNLGEDMHIEVKMKSRGLVETLCSLLDRTNEDLLIIIISFIKKMSIYIENKEEIARQNIIPRLAKLMTSENDMLVNVTLRLLLNLSFDPKLRQEMVKAALLPQFAEMMKVATHQLLVLCILYHISVDRRTRSIFAYTEIIPQLMKMIVSCPGNVVDPELIALGINLASSPRNAQIVCKGPGLKILMKRAFKTRDSLLFKMIRNLSMCPDEAIKKMFLPFLGDLCSVVTTNGSDAVAVEVLGVLGNLSLPDMDFHRLITEMQLLPFILQQLKDMCIKDDLLLGVIVLCGTSSIDAECAMLLVQSGIPDLLITILKAKQDDDEIVLQLVYLFYHLLRHKHCRQLLLKDSLVTEYLMELMNDDNPEIHKFCYKALDIIADSDENMAVRIQQERFRWHNYLWLTKVSGEAAFMDDTDEDYFIPNLQQSSDLFDLQSNLENRQVGVDVEYGVNSDIFGDDYPLDGPHPSPQFYDIPPSSYLYPHPAYSSEDDDLTHQQYALMNAIQQDPTLAFQPTMNMSAGHSPGLPRAPSSPPRIAGGMRGPMDMEVNSVSSLSTNSSSGLLLRNDTRRGQRVQFAEGQASPLSGGGQLRPQNPPPGRTLLCMPTWQASVVQPMSPQPPAHL